MTDVMLDRLAAYEASYPPALYVAPVATSISPDTADADPEGDPVVVTLTGTSFSTFTRILVDGVEYPTTFTNATTISATLDPTVAEVGTVDITARTGLNHSSAEVFTWTAPAGVLASSDDGPDLSPEPEPEDAGETEPVGDDHDASDVATDDVYYPADHSIDEVKSAVTDGTVSAADVLAAELAGERPRKSLVEWLEKHVQ